MLDHLRGCSQPSCSQLGRGSPELDAVHKMLHEQPCPGLRVSPNTVSSLHGLKFTLEKDTPLCIINMLQLKQNLKF